MASVNDLFKSKPNEVVVEWGNIQGDISGQLDLKSKLLDKVDISEYTPLGIKTLLERNEDVISYNVHDKKQLLEQGESIDALIDRVELCEKNDERFEILSDSLDTTAHHTMKAHDRIDKHDELNAQVNVDVMSLYANDEDMNNKIELLSVRDSSIDNRISDLNDRIHGLCRDVISLTADTVGNQQSLKSINSTVRVAELTSRQNESSILSIESRLDELEGVSVGDSIHERLTKLESDVSSIQTVVLSSESRISEIEKLIKGIYNDQP